MNQKKEYTIMIVDDQELNLQFMSNLLKISGFNVIVAEDGEMALEKLKNELPDLILLDVLMPGINGFEICRRLQSSEKTKNIPVIFITSISESQNKIRGLKLGAVDYIIKPFKEEELLARISIHIRLQEEIKERTKAEIELQKAKVELEEKVKERTRKLSQYLAALQEIQIQLIKSEQMSSIGELITGIAHELNNPVSIVVGNIALAETYLQGIINHIKLYQKEFPNHGSIIEKAAEKMDIDFMIEELPKMLSSIKSASDRIRETSVSLRSFARADSMSKIPFDINDAIENNLKILQHRLKANNQRPEIKIVKNYGDLPKINCYPHALNQVLMNLLVNAINSLEEFNYKKNRTYQEILQNPNRINITTLVIESYEVEIIIADNGLGILAHLKDKLSQAFEGIKPTNKKNSLGLSMNYLIVVDKHRGKLKCNSLPKQGTEFVIKLPI
ncbi:MAG: response regulator [Okeania sp. SIO3I5]|uniref:response regulator n=1 Tax=Okeania sp. SIO3I5 TaxID=2607805 RepID=UPI0013B8EACA|nr:response regulator [Okeania sp. SIO3I5]NEQ38510.1 response regulator [Okeania sp. SIO3I5]